MFDNDFRIVRLIQTYSKAANSYVCYCCKCDFEVLFVARPTNLPSIDNTLFYCNFYSDAFASEYILNRIGNRLMYLYVFSP